MDNRRGPAICTCAQPLSTCAVHVAWPSQEQLAAEVTEYVLHARGGCGCVTIGDCLAARDHLEDAWVSRSKKGTPLAP